MSAGTRNRFTTKMGQGTLAIADDPKHFQSTAAAPNPTDTRQENTCWQFDPYFPRMWPEDDAIGLLQFPPVANNLLDRRDPDLALGWESKSLKGQWC